MKMIRLAAAVLVCLAMVPSAEAQSTRRTKVRFNAPVEIPNPIAKAGVMTLPPGEYMFAMADTGTSHHVVRVTDLTGKTVHSMVLTMPRLPVERHQQDRDVPGRAPRRLAGRDQELVLPGRDQR
jgi:hypothetical protein